MLDFRGQLVNSWKRHGGVEVPHQDVCWLDDQHFMVRIGNDRDLVETIDDVLNNPPHADIIRIFDIRNMKQSVQDKQLPYRIRRFYSIKDEKEQSWLVGTGVDINQIPFNALDAELFNEGMWVENVKNAQYL